MASVHMHIRSGTANKRPTTAIAEGQIALATSIASPGLFFKDSTGATIVKIGPVHVGATAPNATPAGSAGNSIGEVWLDTGLTPRGVKIYDGTAFVNATPIGSTTVQGLLELATDAETQAGSDTTRAVTSASLQSKLSDSTSTTSNITIASSTAVKAAYDLANLALPKTGGIVTGNLEIGTAGSLSFEGATVDGFETTIAVVDPTADRTITLPNITGTVVTTGDTGTVTSTMILNGTILDADVNASAAIAGTKISPDFGAQTIVTTGVHSAALGAAATPSITFTGDTNTGIFSPGADQLAVTTNGVERVRLSSTGEFMFKGAGTTPGTDKAVSFNGSAPVNSMVLDSSGRLLLGTSTNRSVGSVTAPVEIEGTTYATSSLSITCNNSASDSPLINLGRSKGASLGSVTGGLVAGDDLGYITFGAADGSTLNSRAAWILCQIDGATGTTDVPGRLVFSTTADGGSSPTERMRIRNGGNISTFCDSGSDSLYLISAATAGTSRYFIVGNHSGTTVNNGTNSFLVFNNGNVQNTNNSYGAISDVKLKENIVDANSQWDDLKALQVRNYNLKEGQTHTQIGLVAQEVELVSPGLVSESPDRDAEGNDLGTVTKGVNYSVLYMKAVKALQEAMGRIETLEQRLTAAGID